MPAVDEPAAARPARRRPGRPRREEGPVVTREAIVAVALDEIQAHGWRGLALRDVARRIGVSLPSVQRHFPTKDDLWRACVDHAVTVVATERVGEAPSVPDPATRVPWLLRAQLEGAALAPGFTAAMWHDHEPGAQERRAYLSERARPVVEEICRRLRMAAAAGVARPVDPEVVAALVAIGMGAVAHAGPALSDLFGIDLSDPAGRERLASGLSDVLLNGLLVHPSN